MALPVDQDVLEDAVDYICTLNVTEIRAVAALIEFDVTRIEDRLLLDYVQCKLDQQIADVQQQAIAQAAHHRACGGWSTLPLPDQAHDQPGSDENETADVEEHDDEESYSDGSNVFSDSFRANDCDLWPSVDEGGAFDDGLSQTSFEDIDAVVVTPPPKPALDLSRLELPVCCDGIDKLDLAGPPKQEIGQWLRRSLSEAVREYLDTNAGEDIPLAGSVKNIRTNEVRSTLGKDAAFVAHIDGSPDADRLYDDFANHDDQVVQMQQLSDGQATTPRGNVSLDQSWAMDFNAYEASIGSVDANHQVTRDHTLHYIDHGTEAHGCPSPPPTARRTEVSQSDDIEDFDEGISSGVTSSSRYISRLADFMTGIRERCDGFATASASNQQKTTVQGTGRMAHADSDGWSISSSLRALEELQDSGETFIHGSMTPEPFDTMNHDLNQDNANRWGPDTFPPAAKAGNITPATPPSSEHQTHVPVSSEDMDRRQHGEGLPDLRSGSRSEHLYSRQHLFVTPSPHPQLTTPDHSQDNEATPHKQTTANPLAGTTAAPWSFGTLVESSDEDPFTTPQTHLPTLSASLASFDDSLTDVQASLESVDKVMEGYRQHGQHVVDRIRGQDKRLDETDAISARILRELAAVRHEVRGVKRDLDMFKQQVEESQSRVEPGAKRKKFGPGGSKRPGMKMK